MPYRGRILLGLTGNIACGKSTVLSRLAEHGAFTIDADLMIHEILRKEGPAYAPVVAEFGPEIVGEDGEIDRRALGKMVFSDPAKLKRLEEIEHPIVRQVIEQRIEAAPSAVVVVDAIKLIESGWADNCDYVLAVTCRRDQQLDRLITTRGYSREEAETRINAQSLQSEKVARADLVIDNSGTKEATFAQVDAAWNKLFPGAQDT